MSIKVSHQSFADCETLTIHGAKRGKCNPTNTVRLQFSNLAATTTEDGWKVVLRFRDENEMKALQDALNYRFPENMKTMQEMPTEEGYYIT